MNSNNLPQGSNAMKKLLMLALFTIFILNSCTNNSSNPLNTDTIPGAPTLLSPTDASSGIAVIPSLSWNASSGAASYTLQVSANSSFSTFVYNNSGLTNTTQQVNGLNPLTLYYWRVSATNTAGTSGWSTAWSFTTTGPSPAAPVLLSPLNGTTTNSSPLLIWIASSGATSYTLQVSVDSLFSSFAYNQDSLTSSSQQLTELTASTYYWRVAATNNNGTSGWSNVWHITTLAPTAPALSSPINGATAQLLSPLLSWSASGGATSFTLQVSLNSSFTSFVYNHSGLTSLNQQVTGLTAQTKYYWRVSASNSYGTSGWSDTWSFTTQ
jgi:predicted phage tail protein